MNGGIGVLFLVAGVWYIYSGFNGYRPIALLMALLKDPDKASETLADAKNASENGKWIAPDNQGEANDPVTDPSGSGLTEPKSYALSQMAKWGWSKSEFDSLDKLWTQESSWNYQARNASSGAYGIPQALPASKMASAGADYMTNAKTQINWGLGYIKSRYGSPSKAWAFHLKNNWY